MRIIGVVLILLGLLFCLSIVGLFLGIPLIVVGSILVVVGGRRKVVIINTVSVANTVPAARPEPPTYQPTEVLPRMEAPLPQANRSPALSAPFESFDRGKWQTLIRYDDDLRVAAERVRALGGRWEDELAEEYLKINDKAYLSKIVERIEGEAAKP